MDTLLNFLLGFSVLGAFITIYIFVMILKCYRTPKPDRMSDFYDCTCTDPNDCEKWCNAKKLFALANSFTIKEECKHPNRLTQVIESSATCETTIEVCADCNQPLTEPKTDCV